MNNIASCQTQQQGNDQVFEVQIDLSKRILAHIFRNARQQPEGQQSKVKLIYDHGLRPEHLHPHYYGSVYQACLILDAQDKLCDLMMVSSELLQGSYPERAWRDIIVDINSFVVTDFFAVNEDAVFQNVQELIKLNQAVNKPLDEPLELKDFIKRYNQSSDSEVDKQVSLIVASRGYKLGVKELKDLCEIGQRESEQQEFFKSPEFKLPSLIEARKPSLNPCRYLFGDGGKLARALVKRARAMSTIPDFLFTTLLPVAASIAGGQNKVIVKADGNYTQPLMFWTAIVGRSGTLKTPAQMAIVSPLEQMEVAAYEQYRRDLEEWNKTDKDDRKEEPVRQRFMSKDSTLEALESIHHQNPRGLLVYRDELIGDLKSMGQYKKNNSDLESTLQQWNGGTLMVDRQSRNVMIPNCSISRTGAYQWSALKEALQGKIENGYNARWLFCAVQAPKRRLNLLSEPSPDTLDGELAHLYQHLRLHQNPKDYLLSRDALAPFDAWHRQLVNWQDEESDKSIELVYSKTEAYTLRIALWLHLVNSALAGIEAPPTISGQTMELAIELAGYYLGQAKLVYLMQDMIHEDALAFWEKTTKLTEPRTITQLRNNNFKRTKLRSVPILRQLAQTLAEQGRGIYNSKDDTWQAVPEDLENYRVNYDNPFQDCDPIKILDTAQTGSERGLEPIGAVLGQIGAGLGQSGAGLGQIGALLGQSGAGFGAGKTLTQSQFQKNTPPKLGQELGQVEKQENQVEIFFNLVPNCNTPDAVLSLWQGLNSQSRSEVMRSIESFDPKAQPIIAKVGQMNLRWKDNTLTQRVR
ncbi:MAG: DUF3987 domain-containing protein [Microcoleaceae cyanobacterium]